MMPRVGVPVVLGAIAVGVHAVSLGGQTATIHQASIALGQAGATVLGDFEPNQHPRGIGEWMVWTDRSCCGGSSSSEIEVVAGGANGTERSLAVRGATAANDIWVGAGALFWFAAPADLTAKSEIAFWARGEGEPYRLYMFGRDPAVDIAAQSFMAGPEWVEIRIPLADLAAVAPEAVRGFLVGRGEPAGPFSLQVDEVRLR